MQRSQFLRQAGVGLLALPLLPYLRPLPQEETCDVVIMGAGLSGLAAARKLTLAGKTVRVLEAQDRVGGRTWSQPIGEGAFIDIGGQWIGKGHNRMYALVKEAGSRTFPTFTEGKNLWCYQGERKSYRGETPPLCLFDLLAVQKVINRLDRLANTIPLNAPWEVAEARKMDQESLSDWIDHTIHRPLARSVIKRVAEGELCFTTQEVSLLQALTSARSTGSLKQAERVDDGALQDRIMGGTQIVSQFLSKELEGSVRLKTPVSFVNYTPSEVEVGNEHYVVKATKLIIAAPLAVLKAVAFTPELPVEKRMLINNMVMGSVVKCHAVYDSPFWRMDGLNGSSTSLDEIVELSVDNSVPGSATGILTTLIHADRAKHLLNLSDEARRQVVIEGFVRLFGEKARQPLRYHDYSFSNNPWIGGAYSGYFKPGIFSAYGSHLKTPCGPLHWAGTETADMFRGFMEGAVLSGERAAQEIMQL